MMMNQQPVGNGGFSPQQPPPFQSRGQAFGEGMVGGQLSAPPSMLEQAAKFNAQVPQTYRPSGSMNGMSANQYQNTLGGQFQNPNGISQDYYQTKRYFPQGQ